MSRPAEDPDRTRVLLARIAQGDDGAAADLLALAYGELRSLAGQAMRGQREETLQPTAVVNEACLRLLGGDAARDWTSRAHLLATAATAMRSVLVDHARRKHAGKRGGGAVRVELEGVAPTDPNEREVDVEALDAALTKLAGVDPELARLVELRYFGGLSIEDTARVLGTSPATVVRSWRTARLYLQRELGAGR